MVVLEALAEEAAAQVNLGVLVKVPLELLDKVMQVEMTLEVLTVLEAAEVQAALEQLE
jgi:hypothetical protein